MVNPDQLPKSIDYADAKAKADLLGGVIDPDQLQIPGPSGKELSKLLLGFETAYLKSGTDLTSEKFSKLAVQALGNLWNGLTKVDARYLEEMGSGGNLQGVDVTKRVVAPGAAPSPDMEVLQESLDIYLGLVYSYATNIFLDLNMWNVPPPGMTPDQIDERRRKARQFSWEFSELTGVSLVQEQENPLTQKALKRMEGLLDKLLLSYATTKDGDLNQDRKGKDLIGDNIDEAGIIPLAERFFPNEVKKWSNILDLADAFSEAAKGGIQTRQLGWEKWEASRDAAAAHVDFSNMRELVNTPGIKEIVEDMVEIFKSGSFQYGPEAHDIHNYAQDGDPDEEKKAKGTPTLQELLKARNPDAKGHEITTAWLLAIVGELRAKYITPYYANYLKSPESRYSDVSYAMKIHAPAALLLYDIRSKGNLNSDLRLMWQIIRLPRAGGDFSFNATRNTTHDRKDHPYSVEILDINNPQYDGLNDEYIPEEADKYTSGPNVGESKKSDPSKAIGNKNVQNLIEVRTWVDEQFTIDTKSLVPVRMDNDLTILPHYWDMIFPDVSDPESQKYQKIDYKNYNDICKAFDKFLDITHHPVKNVGDASEKENLTDVAQGIVYQMVAGTSPFKEAFALLPADTIKGKRFRRIVQELLLRSTKDVYDQFMRATKWKIRPGGKLTKHQHIIEAILQGYESANTVRLDIRKPIMDKIETLGGGTGFAATLFSTLSTDPLSPFSTGAFGFQERERRKMLMRAAYANKPHSEDKH